MTVSYLDLIAPRLRIARDQAGMTQKQAGKALNTDDTNISAYENARTGMSLDMLFKLAALYKVPPGFFFPKHALSAAPTNDDLLRDAIIQKVEGLDPLYLDLLNEVVSAFENHDANKGVGFFRSLLDASDAEE